MDEDRLRARKRALRAAVVVTLGLATMTATSGCERATDAFCGVFENNRYCCDRHYGAWDETARVCRPPLPVPGPFVPPDLPV